MALTSTKNVKKSLGQENNSLSKTMKVSDPTFSCPFFPLARSPSCTTGSPRVNPHLCKPARRGWPLWNGTRDLIRSGHSLDPGIFWPKNVGLLTDYYARSPLSLRSASIPSLSGLADRRLQKPFSRCKRRPRNPSQPEWWSFYAVLGNRGGAADGALEVNPIAAKTCPFALLYSKPTIELRQSLFPGFLAHVWFVSLG